LGRKNKGKSEKSERKEDKTERRKRKTKGFQKIRRKTGGNQGTNHETQKKGRGGAPGPQKMNLKISKGEKKAESRHHRGGGGNGP